MIFIGGPNPILEGFSLGLTPEAQIKDFDIYYNLPVTAGIDVAGADASAQQAPAFVGKIYEDPDDDP